MCIRDRKDGTLMNEFTTPILQEVMENSKIMQLGLSLIHISEPTRH
ncbi:hypothetical protein JMUB7554_27720 [Staphylococcus aureus]